MDEGQRGVFWRVFGLDVRSLALTRIALAMVVLADLWIRAADLRAFHGDAGLLPRAAWVRAYPTAFSLHAASGHLGFQVLLFAVQAVAAAMLLVGWHTRIANVVTWVLLVSLHARNPVILQAGDALLACLLFWSIFVPMGARMSIDAAFGKSIARDGNSPPIQTPLRVASIGTLALALQMPCVYFFSALLKGGPEWHSRFDAVRRALSDDFIASPLGAWLARVVPVRALEAMTVGVLVVELAIPVCLLMPVATARVRSVVLPILLALQVGFFCCLRIGLFPLISTIGVLVLVPSETWRWFGARLGDPRKWRSVERAGAMFARPRALLAPTLSRWVERVGTAAPTFHLGRAASVVCAAAIAFMVLDNVSSVVQRPLLPREVHQLGRAIRLRQSWKMFVRSTKARRWYVLEGTLENGKVVDLLSGVDAEPSADRPAHISDAFKNYRWRKFYGNVGDKRERIQRRAFANYLCRSGSADRPEGERLVHVTAYRFSEPADAPPGAKSPRRSTMFTKKCRLPDPERDRRVAFLRR